MINTSFEINYFYIEVHLHYSNGFLFTIFIESLYNHFYCDYKRKKNHIISSYLLVSKLYESLGALILIKVVHQM